MNAPLSTLRAQRAKQPAPEVPHLEFILLEIISNLEQGKTGVAITNFCHAVRIGRFQDDSCSELRLRQLTSRVIDIAGEFDVPPGERGGHG